MTKVIILSEDDYNAVLAQLNDAQITCDEACAASLRGNCSYQAGEISRKLEYIQDILKKEKSF